MRWRLERSAGVAALLLSVGVFLTTAAPMAVEAGTTTAEPAAAVPPAQTAETGDTLPQAAADMEPLQAEPVLLAVCLEDIPAGTQLRLIGADGAQREALAPEDGMLTLSLVPGQWTVAMDGRADVSFTLRENASVVDVSGPGWTDGESLTLSETVRGSLTVVRTAPSGSAAQYLYRLEGGTVEHDCRVITFEAGSSETQYCTFWGLPAGSYTLYENDVPVATVTIGQGSQSQTVTRTG